MQSDNESIFSEKDFMENTGISIEGLKTVLRDFLNQLQNYILLIKTELSENKIEAVKFNTHAVKGMCYNMTANNLGIAFLQFENAIDSSNIDCYSKNLEHIDNEYIRFVEKVSIYLS